MQKISTFLLSGLIISTLSFFSLSSLAAGKTYTENEFLDTFSGKTKTVILKQLGKPAKTQLSVKPTNATNMVAGVGKEDKSKPVKVEMWYYKNLVKYDDKHTYKETELTMVNDRVMNIGFFNNH
ncbi:MAG: hypothetical protein ACO1N8_12045 [Methylophilus sp.]